MKKWYQLIFRRNSSCADWDAHEREDSSGLFRTLLICQFVQDDVMVTSSSRSSWGLLFRSANWPGISIFESSYSSKTESNILKSWNSKSWNWRNFQKIGNFVKFWSDPPLFSNILKFFIRKESNLLWHMEKYQSQSLTEGILAGLASLHRYPSGHFWPHP